MVVLPNTNASGAVVVADRILSAVAARALPHPGGSPGTVVTISIGVATRTPGTDEPCGALVAQADAALYEAKRMGRGIFVLSNAATLA